MHLSRAGLAAFSSQIQVVTAKHALLPPLRLMSGELFKDNGIFRACPARLGYPCQISLVGNTTAAQNNYKPHGEPTSLPTASLQVSTTSSRNKS